MSYFSNISIIVVIVSIVNANILRISHEEPSVQEYASVSRCKASKANDESNVWEESGLYEGDIMIYHSSQMDKNGLIDDAARWPNATVPYHISDTFSNKEIAIILNAMDEYHNRTCLRFRPYKSGDRNWIQLKADDSGCWSSVGMKNDGQVVNLNSPGCVRHGVVIHELMHAIGFYHQQSAADRDSFVRINWGNISSGREHNFNKYDEDKITDFNVTYDYGSVMHYSGKAFSKNGEKTIEPLQEDVKLGQRKGLSEKDVLKINAMYDSICRDVDTIGPERPPDHLYIIFKWIESTFGF